MKRFLGLILIPAVLILAVPSCATRPTSTAMKQYDEYDRPAVLPSNPANVRVKVSLSKQLVYVMEGSKPLLIMPVTVGKAQTPTPSGEFRIFTKTHRYRANTHGYAYQGDKVVPCYLRDKPASWSFSGTPMPYWCEFKGAYGFHAGWMKPYPASSGCLRIHKNLAPKFFKLVSLGTPVSISASQPEDATLGRNIPRPPDSTPFPSNPDTMMAKTDDFFTMHSPPAYKDSAH